MRAEIHESVPDLLAARRWIGVAIGSLILAGIFALLLVIGRLPQLSPSFGDPLLFKRGLVVHVDLALVIWFYAFIAGLVQLLPGRASPVGRWTSGAAVGGVLLMMIGAGARGAEPVLSNYVPVIDHPLFFAGLLLFALSVLAAILRPRLLPSPTPALLPREVELAVRAAVVAFVVALTCFWGAYLATPSFLSPTDYFERVMWGGGHVLQFATVAAMLGAWLVLLGSLTQQPVIGARAAAVLFALLVSPLFVAPLFSLGGTDTPFYRLAFTRLMELAIFPVVLVVLAFSIRTLRRARREGTLPTGYLRDRRFVGFVVSAGLTLAGFLLGAAISGANTTVPGHYHAAIGGVTASLMALTYELLAPLGMSLDRPRAQRLMRWQLPVYGVGQLLFALGFAFAGAHGAARKTYANEQHVRSLGEWLGLSIMGIGGLVAVAGGLVFLGLVAVAWRHRRPLPTHSGARSILARPGEAHVK